MIVIPSKKSIFTNHTSEDTFSNNGYVYGVCGACGACGCACNCKSVYAVGCNCAGRSDYFLKNLSSIYSGTFHTAELC